MAMYAQEPETGGRTMDTRAATQNRGGFSGPIRPAAPGGKLAAIQGLMGQQRGLLGQRMKAAAPPMQSPGLPGAGAAVGGLMGQLPGYQAPAPQPNPMAMPGANPQRAELMNAYQQMGASPAGAMMGNPMGAQIRPAMPVGAAMGAPGIQNNALAALLQRLRGF